MANRAQVATFVDWSPGLSINKYDKDRGVHRSKEDRHGDSEKSVDISKRKSPKNSPNSRHRAADAAKTSPFWTVVDGKRYPHGKDHVPEDPPVLAQKPAASVRVLPSLVSYPQPELSNSTPSKSDTLGKLCVNSTNFNRDCVKSSSSFKHG
jgi:hypothetical protein